MSNCSAGCPTPGAHDSWGDCLRSKRVQLADVGAHLQNTSVYRASDAYRAAREDGLQPDTVTEAAVDKARRLTDAFGTPYRADQPNNGMPLPARLAGE